MRNFVSFCIIFFIGIFGVFNAPSLVYGQTVDELKKNIEDKTTEIKKLEAEIITYKNDLNKIATLKKNLSNLVAELDATRKKLEAEIKVTSIKVDNADLKIRKLSSDITRKEFELDSRKSALVESLRLVSERDQLSLPEIVVSNKSYDGFWNYVSALDQFNNAIQNNIVVVKNIKANLEYSQTVREQERGSLVDLKTELADRKKIAEDTKKKNLALLAKAKNNEAIYAKILKQKEAQKEAFEKELRDYESKLKFTLDPTSVPSKGSKVLSSPLDNLRVTQYFGDTAFAKSGAYNGRGHNGVDFAASIGTKVRSTLSGKVIAVNTQVAYMCQYGKWVLIEHDNGLTTLYAHLSVVSVDSGDRVQTGQLVGYSGDTGYSTGPHLHFTVYASKAVEFKKYSCNSGASLTIPVAAFSGYLNPMDYLR